MAAWCQISLASLLFTDDHGDRFPGRRLPSWPTQLRNYYASTNLLICPSDERPLSAGVTNADSAPRSYLMNGWNDYFTVHGGNLFSTDGMPVSGISLPSQTIVFGEKVSASIHY